MLKVLAVSAVLAALVVPTGAQSYQAFGTRQYDARATPDFADAEISSLIGTLDTLLSPAGTGSAWPERAGDALWQFARRLQAARLSPSQETRVLAHLDGIAKSRPDAAPLIASPRRIISTMTIGKPAPEIVGRDLDGKTFKLSEFRGKVVLLTFSADWCAICRAQAPYERFLLDKYARWPFALLGVETGSSREAARQAHATKPLSLRSWWDEPRVGATMGPIASAWSVSGLPASYLIDGHGIIQSVDLREENLLIAVRHLLELQADADARARRQK